jgi:hypothetical protein
MLSSNRWTLHIDSVEMLKVEGQWEAMCRRMVDRYERSVKRMRATGFHTLADHFPFTVHAVSDNGGVCHVITDEVIDTARAAA